MISILREGPKLVCLGTTRIHELSEFVKTNLNATETDLNNALELSDENNTVVYITDPGKKVARLYDMKTVILIPMTSDNFFSSIINLNCTRYIEDSHIGPGILNMRVMGDFDKILQSICDTYNCKVHTIEECLDIGTNTHSILSFTDKPINNKISLTDLKPQHVLIDMEINKFIKRMRIQALRFLNEGLTGIEWNDMQVRIYDRYSKYMLHYKRLSLILDTVDAGFILGEGWAKDYPRFLMSVLVYQIRLFTLWQPEQFKRTLLGLEYLDDGTRIVDLDLMIKNKKIDWPMAFDKDTKGFDRAQMGKFYRNQLINKLSSDDRLKMLRYEDQIIKSRY